MRPNASTTAAFASMSAQARAAAYDWPALALNSPSARRLVR
jgi:hypothetical protein